METLIEMLSAHLREGNGAGAQCFRGENGWERRTYAQMHSLVLRTAHRLRALGAGDGGCVAIVSRTRPDWTIVDLAAALIGAPVIPVYPTASQAQFDAIERATSPVLIVVDRDDLRSAAPQFRLGGRDGDLGDLERPTLTSDEKAEIERAAASVRPSDTYSIVFSSGSTGEPKGCVLSNDNFAAVVRMAGAVESSDPNGAGHRERAFVYLPLAHVSARLQQLTTFSLGGELLYGFGGTAEILAQITELQPTYVPGVPRLFESAYARVGGSWESLREVFGPSLRYALSGGAPMDEEVQRAYERAGITLVEGYGLTETSAALALSAPHDRRSGSVGRALPGVELRVADDGEILARGANVFEGYLGAEQATDEAFVEGWFRTGDLGWIDDDGFLFITGRKKNLIVTSTGKNVAPEPIENQLRIALGVADVIVVGDRRPFLAAVVFAPEPLDEAEVVAAIRHLNAEVSPPERVRKVVVVAADLSGETGTLTASGKIVRPVLLERFAPVVDALYDGTHPRALDVHPSPVPVLN